MSYSLSLIESIEKNPKAASSHDHNINNQIKDVLNRLETIREKMLYPARFELLRFLEKQHHIAQKETEKTYSILGENNKAYTFPKISSITSISQLPEATISAMIEWLTCYAQSNYAIPSQRNNSNKEFRGNLYYIIPSTKRARKKVLEYMGHTIDRLIRFNEWAVVTASEQRYTKAEFTYYRAYELGHMLHFTREEMDDFILHVFPNVSAIRKTVRDAVEAYCFNYGLHEASLEPNLTEQYNSVSEINNIPEEASKILLLNDKELLALRLQHELKIEDDRLYKYYKTHADLLMVASEIAKEKGLVEPEPEEVVSVPVTKDLYEKFADKAGQGDIDIISMIVWYDFEINRPTRTAYKVYIDALLCAYMMLIVNNGIVYQKNKHIKAVLSALALISDAESRCPIDDIFDPSAESAVKRYQRKRGITANGIVNQTTLQAILEDLDTSIAQMVSIADNLKKGYGQTLRIVSDEDDAIPNETVAALQKALILLGERNYDCGYDREGIFGVETEKSVRNYQSLNKMLRSANGNKNKSIPGEADQECLKHIVQRVERKAQKYLAAKKALVTLPLHMNICRNALAEETIRNADKTIPLLWKTWIIDRKDMKAYLDLNHDAFYLPVFNSIDWQDAALSFSSVSNGRNVDSNEYNQDFLIDLSLDARGQWVANSIYNRIPDLITRKRAIEKRDLLALIWIIVILYLENTNPEDVDTTLYKTPVVMLDKIQGLLESANFEFYEANPLEYSITRAWLIHYWKRNGENLSDIYSEIVNHGQNDISSQEVYIKTKSSLYGIWFYACEKETQESIQILMRNAASSGIIKHFANDEKKYLTAIISNVAEQLKCGWQWLPASHKPLDATPLYMNSFGLIGGYMKELFIKVESTKTTYCVHFCGCQEKSLKRIAELLYYCSKQAETNEYNEPRKRLKHILAMASKVLKCDCFMQSTDSTSDKWLRMDQMGILRPNRQAKN